MSEKRKWRMTRRGFLIGVGATGTTLALGVAFGLPYGRIRLADMFENSAGAPASMDAPPNAWFEISADNQVKLFIPKVEMGQGVHTALAQLAAEELEIDWAQLSVVQATTALGPFDSRGTSASNSVSSLWVPLREAAATMREMLRTEAAKLLNLPAAQLQLESGVFSNDNARLTYGEVVSRVSSWTVPEAKPPLKDPSTFRYIGQPVPRVDLPDKIVGKAIYGYDMRLPGMLYGAVARPPTLGATLRRVAAGEAASKPGVVTVVAEPDFAGVVAESRQAAYQGVFAMSLEWNETQRWQQADIERLITVGEGTGVTIQRLGDAPDQLRIIGTLRAEYRTPMAAHAHLEAQAALADVQPDGVKIWASTQFPDMVRGEVATLLKRDKATIEVIPTYLGGGFGRKSGVEPALEAARLSAAAGKPVHVGWSRTEDFLHGYLRPPTHHVLRGNVNADGRMWAFEHQQASGHVAAEFLPGFLMAIFGADFGAWRGAMIPYAATHLQTVAWRNELPLRTGWWRGLGLLANVFALESFVDELAHAAKADPLQFRLNNLPDDEKGQRLRTVLTRAAELASWNTAVPAGRARGIACCVDAGTAVAHVAEVGVEGGNIRVHKVTAVVEPGLVVNPDGATAQTQGNIVMGLSSTLLEKITVKDGQIEQGNFNQYPLLTLAETPDIHVELISRGSQPFGMGEPPMGPIAAAVANAVFALTGQRLRELPLRLTT
ncbi:MAG: molybdopterin-dependent oxidoreductase [Chloroflexaceae bacterium]|jgi:isoquinoline 1-oxidoreductase beta subunit|nr:molybdopterin-dependent oxidoreductase [Chloroflexaceae bacterium]